MDSICSYELPLIKRNLATWVRFCKPLLGSSHLSRLCTSVDHTWLQASLNSARALLSHYSRSQTIYQSIHTVVKVKALFITIMPAFALKFDMTSTHCSAPCQTVPGLVAKGVSVGLRR